MTTYTTTAGNVAFYMNLAVVASTPDEAETKFLTFIADSKAEDEEYEMALAISPDAERALQRNKRKLVVLSCVSWEGCGGRGCTQRERERGRRRERESLVKLLCQSPMIS